jgi:hypothetical protein
MLSNHCWSIALQVFLVAAAIANPVLSFVNGKQNRLAVVILITGLLAAGALGYVFILNYQTNKFLMAVAVGGYSLALTQPPPASGRSVISGRRAAGRNRKYLKTNFPRGQAAIRGR